MSDVPSVYESPGPLQFATQRVRSWGYVDVAAVCCDRHSVKCFRARKRARIICCSCGGSDPGFDLPSVYQHTAETGQTRPLPAREDTFPQTNTLPLLPLNRALPQSESPEQSKRDSSLDMTQVEVFVASARGFGAPGTRRLGAP